MCSNLLVGVSGSIHCLNIHSYLYKFRESFADNIKIIMTKASSEMVNPRTVELYTDDKVFIDSWDQSNTIKAPHIQLTRWADLFIVLPASANILGKSANGIADSLLSTAILSYPKTIVFAPAMNPAMWHSKSVQRNVKILKDYGHYIIQPLEGISITSGEWDLGLGPTLDEIMIHIQHVRMKELKDEYWSEAVATKPLTPLAKKLAALESSKLDNDSLLAKQNGS